LERLAAKSESVKSFAPAAKRKSAARPKRLRWTRILRSKRPLIASCLDRDYAARTGAASEAEG
jgi:hypothetical protein